MPKGKSALLTYQHLKHDKGGETRAMKRFLKKVATTTLAAALVLPAGLAGAAPMFPDVNSKTVTPDVQEAIESLASQGIIKGFPDGTFGPNKAITRAQFAKILAQIEGLQPNPAAAAQFVDVKDPEQKGWVGALYAAGLTTGTTATTYSPNKPIQRDQAATFLVRALELSDVAKELNLTPSTTDGARINDSHRANVGLLEKVGLIKGYPNGSFGPGDPFKRQQAANLLYKVQQNGDEYVSAAKALVNKVEVTQNEDGTLTIKGAVSGAAKVDVAIAEAAKDNNEAKVVYEKKGVAANEKGEFELKTEQRFVAPGTYTVTVTAYNAEGTEIAKLTKDFKVGEGEVKGYTDAPDLVRVYSEGKYVYFVFDEEVKRIEDEDAFFVVNYAGTIARPDPDKVRIDEENRNVVYADFLNAGRVAIATLAGVEGGAVSDADGNESVEASLPLNNVKVGGSTGGPDLKSVKIDSFRSGEDFVVEFEFDEKMNLTVADATYFMLYTKDGQVLTGNPGTLSEKNSTTVEVEFTAPAGVDSRDRIARAVVQEGAVEDDDKNNPDDTLQYSNPWTAVDARTKLSTNYLRSANIDVENGEIEYVFSRNVEDVAVIDNAYNYGVNMINGDTVVIGDLSVNRISVDKNKVTIKLTKGNPTNAAILAGAVGAVVFDMNLAAPEVEERIVTGVVPLSRSFAAGETASPLLERIRTEYDKDDELLTVTYYFSQELDSANSADRFVIYTEDGEKYTADRIDDIEDNKVIVEFEIEEEIYKTIVLAAVENDAVAGDGYKEGLNNPAASLPIK